ncbi:hypothetical protein BABINDRAFT_183266 [Babjeviella inositovora NRRL Y-12698]|uniref:Uncharacterized protein n=1 Tax=Babjeviella inositovora NRRL Y-12698 TaxID=984486 RepID=A0A1E3QV04_9ASCO|nr:uncharacterized protein BABINDRAFT_183266 [Babjeviella inositovora NRRL Y-12698]ODQ80882.1 hypothetical protein BABINDRAFT_183266 [Babjeviella inositovora NRRL Y-12698]
MKFGKTFVTHQVPEWSHSYMNYKDLKKQIKTIVAQQRLAAPGTPDATLNDTTVKTSLATFFFALDRNVEQVDDFYNKQYSEYERRLRKLAALLGGSTSQLALNLAAVMDEDEVEELISVFLELRNGLRNLKWFGELNKRGFQKILKKLDKKVGTQQRAAYLHARVNALPFAHEGDILKHLALINGHLGSLGQKVDEIKSVPSPAVPPSGPESPPLHETKLAKFNGFLSDNNADAMLAKLIVEYQSPVLAPHRLLLSLLNQATIYNATLCIDALLQILPSLANHSDVTSRNYFHNHVIALGKATKSVSEPVTPVSGIRRNLSSIQPASMLSNAHERLFRAFGPDGVNSNDSRDGLAHALEHLPIHLRPALLQRDNHRRTPLHYAAQYGLIAVTQLIMEYLQEWGVWDARIAIDRVDYWGDAEGLTPLHLSVLGSHPLTARTLIAVSAPLSCPGLLVLATKLDAAPVAEVLLDSPGVDIDFVDVPHNQETSLYIACKMDFGACVQLLLMRGANPEIGEATFGWTPLFVAAAQGNRDIVAQLVAAGARYDLADESGWLPMEHACLRGHLVIADMLRPVDYDPRGQMPSPLPAALALEILTSPMYLLNASASSVNRLPETVSDRLHKLLNQSPPPPPVKSFGHRFLQPDESLVLITLGTTDARDDTAAILLHKVPVSRIHATELDTALSVVVHIRNAPDVPPVVLDLPLDDTHGGATEPLQFKLTGCDAAQLVVAFDIVPTYQASDQKQRVLGRAVAFLKNVYTAVGNDRRSLHQVATVPIMEAESLEVLGSVRFEYTLVTPFQHPHMAVDRTDTYWKSLITTRVIGHRGMGKNVGARTSLQLGENTVESFIAAASLGASYVEFDVQLTKDHVPVVYHDFLVAESGVDVPMHVLTVEQFLGLYQGGKAVHDDGVIRMRPKSKSFISPRGLGDDDLSFTFNDRMKLTKTWKDKGFKGNARGSSIASPFVTLVDLFRRLPKNVGFNIECKYPMLDEAEKEDMGEIAIDINLWVDTVLQTVYDHADGRDVIFSSFHPDICVLLSLKQPSIPILFLTEAGTTAMADVRAASLQAAIRFARTWNLLGIVSAAETLVKCPRLTSIVKASGLVCVTYGVSNNDPALSQLQMDNGVDAVIVDSVLAVRSGLTKREA